jgi:putative transposase
MAGFAPRLPVLVDGVELFPHLAQQRDLATPPYHAARKDPREAGARANPQRGDHRQPIGENEPKRGRRGYDGGKKVKGRKRHLLVDTTGLLMQVLVHEANVQDYDGGKWLLAPLKGLFPRLKLIWADSAYEKGGFVEWVKAQLGWTVEIVKHPWSGLRGVWAPEGAVIDWEQIRPRGFHVLKRRWVVERTLAWLSTWRRLAKDYEVLPASEEAWIYVAMIRIMLGRLVQT